MAAFSASLNRRQEKALLARYEPAAVARIMARAADEGAKAGSAVMRSRAPVGIAEHLSQLYRKAGLQHGALRGSVRAAPIRRRGSVLREFGQEIGPMGRGSVARAFVAARTGWVAQVASLVLSVAQRASDALLEAYARG